MTSPLIYFTYERKHRLIEVLIVFSQLNMCQLVKGTFEVLIYGENPLSPYFGAASTLLFPRDQKIVATSLSLKEIKDNPSAYILAGL